MYELTQVIPDVNVLLALEPEELGAKLLFLLRRRNIPNDMFMPSNLTAEIWPNIPLPGQQYPYPPQRRSAINQAFTEAWAWLEAQGLIVPAPDSNGPLGWKVLSRRAKKFENEEEFIQYRFARMLQKEALHPRIAEKVWLAFMRGGFDYAVLHSMKAVEVAVRAASRLEGELVGRELMQKAFSPKTGPLADFEAEKGEQLGRMELFAGAIGSYKNPQSHRDVNLEDPLEAIEIILLANHLLRIVESRAQANAVGNAKN